jgi:predicted nucleic acid-binding protein
VTWTPCGKVAAPINFRNRRRQLGLDRQPARPDGAGRAQAARNGRYRGRSDSHCDIILLEILQGARDDAHAARIERALETYPIASMLDAGLAVQAARNDRRLRALDITVRKTADLIIGTFCIAGGHTLVHDDRDFHAMENHLGLTVIHP